MTRTRRRSGERVSTAPNAGNDTAKPRRDWLDFITLITGVIGVVVVVFSTILTQWDAAASDERAAKSLELLTNQAEASRLQANASMAAAAAASDQVAGMHLEVEQMKSQSKALGMMASAANGQLAEAAAHNKRSMTTSVHFNLDVPDSGKAGIFIANLGLAPAKINNIRIYLDNRRVDHAAVLLMEDSTNYTGKSAHWNDTDFEFAVLPSNRYSIIEVDVADVKSPSRLERLIRERVFIIGRTCTLYGECQNFCTKTKNSQCAASERELHRQASLRS